MFWRRSSDLELRAEARSAKALSSAGRRRNFVAVSWFENGFSD